MFPRRYGKPFFVIRTGRCRWSLRANSAPRSAPISRWSASRRSAIGLSPRPRRNSTTPANVVTEAQHEYRRTDSLFIYLFFHRHYRFTANVPCAGILWTRPFCRRQWTWRRRNTFCRRTDTSRSRPTPNYRCVRRCRPCPNTGGTLRVRANKQKSTCKRRERHTHDTVSRDGRYVLSSATDVVLFASLYLVVGTADGRVTAVMSSAGGRQTTLRSVRIHLAQSPRGFGPFKLCTPHVAWLVTVAILIWRFEIIE